MSYLVSFSLPHLSVFSLFSRSYCVCVTFSTFSSLHASIHVQQCVFLIFHIFQSSLPYSRSYSVCFSFCMLFSVSRYISYPTIWVSHFPHFSVFSPYSRSYSVCVTFSTFFSFLTKIQALQSVFFNISRFSLFLALFQVLQCVCLIFPVFNCSPYTRS
jgi:hypothetical protein